MIQIYKHTFLICLQSRCKKPAGGVRFLRSTMYKLLWKSICTNRQHPKHDVRKPSLICEWSLTDLPPPHPSDDEEGPHAAMARLPPLRLLLNKAQPSAASIKDGRGKNVWQTGSMQILVANSVTVDDEPTTDGTSLRHCKMSLFELLLPNRVFRR
jgi:hypothetical protein